jgi:hypothetical protein
MFRLVYFPSSSSYGTLLANLFLFLFVFIPVRLWKSMFLNTSAKLINCAWFAGTKRLQGRGWIVLQGTKSPCTHIVLHLFLHQAYHIRLLMIPYIHCLSSVPMMWLNFVLYLPQHDFDKTVKCGPVSARGTFHQISTEILLNNCSLLGKYKTYALLRLLFFMH